MKKENFNNLSLLHNKILYNLCLKPYFNYIKDNTI